MIEFRSSTVHPPQSRNFSRIHGSSSSTFNSSSAIFNATMASVPGQNRRQNILLEMVAATPPTGNYFSDYVTELETISRLVNGISIQSSLISGNIPLDEFIAEILRMGSVKTEKLEKAKPDDVKAAMEKYKGLGKELDGEGETKTAEKAMLLRGEMREEALKIGDVEKLPGMAAYKENLNKIKSFTGIDESHVDPVLDIINLFKPMLADINTMDPDKATRSTDTTFVLVGQKADDLVQAYTNFKPYGSLIDGLRSLDIASNFMNPLFKHIELEKKYKSMNFEKTGNTGKITGNLDALKSVTAIFKLAEVQFSLLEEFLTSRNSANDQTIVHVAGFPNGVKDLLKLSGDAGAEWLQRAANGTESFSESFKNAFAPLEKLTKELDDVDKKWTLKKEALESVRKMHEVVQWLATEHTISKEFEGVAKCDGDFTVQPTDPTKIEHTKKLMDKLSQQFTQAMQFVYDEKFNLTDLKSKVNSTKTDTKGKIKELKGSSFLNGIIEMMTKMHTDLTNLKTFLKDRNTEITAIEGTMKEVTDFQNSLMGTKYRIYVKCLGDTKDDPKIKETIGSIQRIRDKNDNPKVQEVIYVAGVVLNSKDDIKKVKDAGGAMKGVKNEDLKKVLAALEKLNVEELKTAGRGMRTMERLREMRQKELKPLFEDLQFIADEAGKWGLPTDDQNRLSGIASVQTSLTAMYDEVYKVIGAVTQKPKSILEYGPALEEAANVKSVTLDIKKLIESLEKLEKAMKKGQTGVRKRAANNLPGVISALKSLNSLNLNFAGYKFNAAVASLANLNTFFVHYTPTTVVNSGPSGPSGVPSASASVAPPGAPLAVQSAFVSATESPGVWSYILYVLLAVGGAGLVVGIIIVVICFLKKKGIIGKKDSKKSSKGIPRESDSLTNNGDKPLPKGSGTDSADSADADKKQKKEEDREKEVAKCVQPLHDILRKGITVEEMKSASKMESEERTAKCGVLVPPVRTHEDLTDDELFSLVINFAELLKVGADYTLTPAGFVTRTFLEPDVIYYMTVPDPHESERRYMRPECRDDTRIKVTGFKNDYINASFETIDGCKWIMAQAPLDGTEEGKVSTMEKHWAMIDQQNVAVTAQLCDFREKSPAAPKKKKKKVDPQEYNSEKVVKSVKVEVVPEEVEKQVCGRFYPEEVGQTMKFGRYTITCVEIVPVGTQFPTETEKFKIFRLEYTDETKKTTKRVDLVRYTGWTQLAPPGNHRNTLRLVAFCSSYQKNVLVICNNGAGRSGAFVGVKLAIHQSLKGKKPLVGAFFWSLRCRRYGAIDKSFDVLHMFYCIAQALFDIRHNQFVACFVNIKFTYRQSKAMNWRGPYFDGTDIGGWKKLRDCNVKWKKQCYKKGIIGTEAEDLHIKAQLKTAYCLGSLKETQELSVKLP